MVFAEALSEYLIDGLSEALAEADEPTPPVPLAADRYVALSAMALNLEQDGVAAIRLGPGGQQHSAAQGLSHIGGEGMKLKPDGVGRKAHAREPRPFERVLALPWPPRHPVERRLWAGTAIRSKVRVGS